MGAAHVLIVGGTKGAGRVLVRRWAQKQFNVSVVGRTAPAEIREDLPNVHFSPADLSDNDATSRAIASAIAQYGKLSHLAFFQRYRGGEDRWAGELQVSLTATKTIIESCAEQFDPESPAGIVIVSSAGARFILADQPVGYHAVKAALCQMVRYYALQLGPRGIRVNTVSPDMYVKEESRRRTRKTAHSVSSTIRSLRWVACARLKTWSTPSSFSAARRHRSSPGRISLSMEAFL